MILKTIGGRKRGQIHLFESSDIQVVAPKELAWKPRPARNPTTHSRRNSKSIGSLEFSCAASRYT